MQRMLVAKVWYFSDPPAFRVMSAIGEITDIKLVTNLAPTRSPYHRPKWRRLAVARRYNSTAGWCRPDTPRTRFGHPRRSINTSNMIAVRTSIVIAASLGRASMIARVSAYHRSTSAAVPESVLRAAA
jgi:hypothetical protein